MEYLTIKEVEKLHEQYSLNINNLIKGFKENPEKYAVFVHNNKDKTIQTIMITDKQKKLLFMELSKSFITVLDEESGLEYRIINDESRLSLDTIKECEIYEIYGKNKDILVDLSICYSEYGKMKCEVIDGEFSFPSDNGEDVISAEFSRKFFFEEPDDEELEGCEVLQDDEYEQLTNLELDLEIADDEDYELDDDSEELDKEDYEELEEELEDIILDFRFFQNDKEYQISSDEFDNVVQNIKEITEQIASDFEIRVEEISQLRKGINNILKMYKKFLTDNKEQMEK